MAKAKKPETIHPQTVLPGTVIHSKQTDNPQVVESVDVVLHLSNGWAELYVPGEQVTLAEFEPEDIEFPAELSETATKKGDH